MYNKEQEITQLRLRINQEKERVKQAIRNGAIFEEVKTMTLQIKEMERKLLSLQNYDPNSISNN